MKKLLVVALAALALPAGATAKEITSAAVCGADGCQQVDDPQRLDLVIGSGGPPAPPPAHKDPFYRLRLTIDGHPMRLLVMPSQARVRGFDGHWYSIPSGNRAAWSHLLAGVRPFASVPGGTVSRRTPFPWWLIAAIGLGIGFAALFRPNRSEGDTPHGSTRRQGGDRHRFRPGYRPSDG